MPAYNERFHASGGVRPQKHLCELATASPADSSVKPATTQSRLGVVCNGKAVAWR
jgi:hypothetical protein